MSDGNFTPKLGRIRDPGRGHPHGLRAISDPIPSNVVWRRGPFLLRDCLCPARVALSSGRGTPGKGPANSARHGRICDTSNATVSPAREIQDGSTMPTAMTPMGKPSSSGRSTIRTSSASSFLPRTAIG